MSRDASLDESQLAWRGVILFGLNTATYKIALGQTLEKLAHEQQTHVTTVQLAQSFFELYLDRLTDDPRPQLSNPTRKTVMERIVESHLQGELSIDQAVGRVEREAFGDVLPRFHTIGHMSVPTRFYELTEQGLILTDSLLELFDSHLSAGLADELEARWDLLEAAFLMRQPWMMYEGRNVLNNDTEQVFLGNGAFRTNITWLRKMLTGYQQGRCFYCGEFLGESGTHVDHVVPWAVVRHDQPWNLVLAHGHCNILKRDYLPDQRTIAMLIARNEFLIESNHPLKDTLIHQTGATAAARLKTVQNVYQRAIETGQPVWNDTLGFDITKDVLYKTIIRKMYFT